MKEFPDFMKRAVNRIATSDQATPGSKDTSSMVQTEVRWRFGRAERRHHLHHMFMISTNTCWWSKVATR